MSNETLLPEDLDRDQAAPVTRATRPGFGSTVLPEIDRSAARARLRPRTETRFEVTGSLGQGGLGDVVAAIDHDIGRRVAIKRVRADRVSEPALIRFLQEIHTVGRLEHANIIPIHDVGRDESGALYFVMRYVDGETLEAILDRLRAGDPEAHRRFGFEHRVRICAAVLEALAFAHSKGVVHRDIKPANIMIGRYGEVLLLDWGIARLLDGGELEPEESDASSPGLTRVGSVLGTPAYMSPEQARGEPVDARTDLYALAVLLHELLTTRHYLADCPSAEQMILEVQVRKVPFASLSRSPHQDVVPMDLTWFIDKGVQKDPANRYQSAGEMLDRLARRAEGDIPVQCHLTFTRRAMNVTFRFLNRHGLAVAVGFALILGAAGLAAVGGMVALGGAVVAWLAVT